MADMTAISQVLSSIKTATDIVKLFRETNISWEKTETKLKLAELVEGLNDARTTLTGFFNIRKLNAAHLTTRRHPRF
jgi:hypothetical protein